LTSLFTSYNKAIWIPAFLISKIAFNARERSPTSSATRGEVDVSRRGGSLWCLVSVTWIIPWNMAVAGLLQSCRGAAKGSRYQSCPVLRKSLHFFARFCVPLVDLAEPRVLVEVPRFGSV
jgi:hypothetical protein